MGNSPCVSRLNSINIEFFPFEHNPRFRGIYRNFHENRKGFSRNCCFFSLGKSGNFLGFLHVPGRFDRWKGFFSNVYNGFLMFGFEEKLREHTG